MRGSRIDIMLWLVLAGLLLWPAPARGQAACGHVTFVVESSSATLDRQAICNAAQPWADDGIRTFILLTDFQPADTDDWFAYLDQVELTHGVRDEAGLLRNILALEASTSGVDWGYTVTIGEALFDTPLDSDASLTRVENALRDGLRQGAPAAGYTAALATGYMIFAPGLSPLATGALAVVAVGGLGVAGYLLYPRVVRPRLTAARRRRALERHLATLRTPVANLLNAAHRLLDGATPEESVLYQLFEVYGGAQADSLRERVREWLRRSQAALADAFEVRQRLLDPEVQAKRPLDQQVRDWEMLYLTLVGSDPDIQALDDESLQDLLNPMLAVAREAPEDAQLARQLDGIRAELEGQPLKVTLQAVDPAGVDEAGILGYIDEIKAIIVELQAAKEAAPEHLEAAREERLAVEEELPDDPFGMTKTALFGAIDDHLGRAESELDDGRFLLAMDHALAAADGLATIRAYARATAEQGERERAVQHILDAGYRPPRLAVDRAELVTDRTAVNEHLQSGDFGAANQWLSEFQTDGERLHKDALAWRGRHESTASGVAELTDEVARLRQLLRDDVEPAWALLARYPPGNWSDITEGTATLAARLDALAMEALPEVTRLNELDVQALDEAERRLIEAQAEAAALRRELEAIVHRLAELNVIEANIDAGLAQASEALHRAITFRDAEDPKIGPEVDRQLQRAELALAEAQRDAGAREFVTAADKQQEARRLALDAYESASAQVQRINALQAELDTARSANEEMAGRLSRQLARLTAVMQTPETHALLRELDARQSEARQIMAGLISLEDHALAEALSEALAAYAALSERLTEAEGQLVSDRQSYEALQDRAREAIQRAERAIFRAEAEVRQRGARGAGRHALDRARATLPDGGELNGATRAALERAIVAANEAAAYAADAEQKARAALAAEAQRQMRRVLGGILVGSGRLPGSGRFPSSGRLPGSSSRRPSGGSRRPASPTRSSRRSSSGGTSRRSSSGGSSRRSSGGGRSRRS